MLICYLCWLLSAPAGSAALLFIEMRDVSQMVPYSFYSALLLTRAHSLYSALLLTRGLRFRTQTRVFSPWLVYRQGVKVLIYKLNDTGQASAWGYSKLQGDSSEVGDLHKKISQSQVRIRHSSMFLKGQISNSSKHNFSKSLVSSLYRSKVKFRH
jgi:hypothetical protein